MRIRKDRIKNCLLIIAIGFIWCKYQYDIILYWEELKREVLGSKPLILFRNFDRYQAQPLILNTSTCKIPDFDPYSEDVMSKFREERIGSCGERDRLVVAVQDIDSDVVELHLNQTEDVFQTECEYRKIYHDWNFSDAPYEAR